MTKRLSICSDKRTRLLSKKALFKDIQGSVKLPNIIRGWLAAAALQHAKDAQNRWYTMCFSL